MRENGVFSQRPDQKGVIVKLRFIVAGAVILASLGYLVLGTGRSEDHSIIVVDASAVAERPGAYADREIRMRGFVKTGSILRFGDRADFVVALDGKEIPVRFTGATQLPDTFTDGAPVRVDGRLDASNRLVSTKVEAKCASKYEAEHAERMRDTRLTGAAVRGAGMY